MKPTDKRVLDAIIAHIDRTGISPSVRNIQVACGMKSSSVAYYHIKKLERMGHLEMVVSDSWARSMIRVKGHGPYQVPTEAVELVRLLQVGAITSKQNPSITIVKSEYLERLYEWAERVGA